MTVNWTDVGGPLYLTRQTPPIDAAPFTLRPAEGPVDSVPGLHQRQTSTPYGFCVANLALIHK